MPTSQTYLSDLMQEKQQKKVVKTGFHNGSLLQIITSSPVPDDFFHIIGNSIQLMSIPLHATPSTIEYRITNSGSSASLPALLLEYCLFGVSETGDISELAILYRTTIQHSTNHGYIVPLWADGKTFFDYCLSSKKEGPEGQEKEVLYIPWDKEKYIKRNGILVLRVKANDKTPLKSVDIKTRLTYVEAAPSAISRRAI